METAQKLFKIDKDTVVQIIAAAFLFVPLVFSHFTFEKFETVKLCLFSVLAGASLIYLVKKNEVHINKVFVSFLSLFLVFAGLGTLFSPDIVYSLVGKSFFWFGFYFIFIWVVFNFVLYSIATKDRVEFFVKILVAVGLVNAVMSVLQAFGIGYYESPYTIGYLLRPPALIGNPNFTAMFLAGLAPLVLYFASRATQFKSTVYFHIAAFVYIFSLMTLSSRGAILGLAAALVVVIILALFSKSKSLVVTTLVYALLAVVMYLSFTGPFRATYTSAGPIDTADANVYSRIETWNLAIDLIKENPLVGIGFGNLPGNMHDPHNIFLYLGAAGGLPLLITFLSFVIYGVILGLRKIKESGLYVAMLGSLAAILLAASFNPTTLVTWMLLGLILVSLYTKTNQVKLEFKYRPVGIVIGALLIICGLGLIIGQATLYSGLKANAIEENYEKGYKLLKYSSMFYPFSEMTRQHLAGDAILLNKDKSEIEARLASYISLHENDPDLNIGAGRLYYQWYKQTNSEIYFTKATELLTKAIQINPQVQNGYFYLALFYYEQQDYKTTQNKALEGLTVNPDDQALWGVLLNTYLVEKDYQSAVMAAEKIYFLDVKNKSLKHVVESLKRGDQREPLILELPKSPFHNVTGVPRSSL